MPSSHRHSACFKDWFIIRANVNDIIQIYIAVCSQMFQISGQTFYFILSTNVKIPAFYIPHVNMFTETAVYLKSYLTYEYLRRCHIEFTDFSMALCFAFYRYILKYRIKYSVTPIIQTLVIWIGLAFQVTVENSTKTNLPWNHWLSDRVQYSKVLWLYRTSNQAWLKGLDAGTYCNSNSRWGSQIRWGIPKFQMY
jgi:hypothetical protein